jgi:hypothetical protein
MTSVLYGSEGEIVSGEYLRHNWTIYWLGIQFGYGGLATAASKMHSCEMRARKSYAHEIQVSQMHIYKIQTFEMHGRERDTPMRCTCP